MYCRTKPIGYLCAIKLLKSNHITKQMDIKRLQTATLADALKTMRVGETCLPPKGYDRLTVCKTCSRLRHEGYTFVTTTKTGDGQQVITRLK